jgi:hypothetical protein
VSHLGSFDQFLFPDVGGVAISSALFECFHPGTETLDYRFVGGHARVLHLGSRRIEHGKERLVIAEH